MGSHFLFLFLSPKQAGTLLRRGFFGSRIWGWMNSTSSVRSESEVPWGRFEPGRWQCGGRVLDLGFGNRAQLEFNFWAKSRLQGKGGGFLVEGQALVDDGAAQLPNLLGGAPFFRLNSPMPSWLVKTISSSSVATGYSQARSLPIQ